MKVKVLYFAQFADIAGKTEETLTTDEKSPEAVYAQVRTTYQFPHDFDKIQVAINHQLAAHSTPLNEGDEIAFLPPMTGG